MKFILFYSLAGIGAWIRNYIYVIDGTSKNVSNVHSSWDKQHEVLDIQVFRHTPCSILPYVLSEHQPDWPAARKHYLITTVYWTPLQLGATFPNMHK